MNVKLNYNHAELVIVILKWSMSVWLGLIRPLSLETGMGSVWKTGRVFRKLVDVLQIYKNTFTFNQVNFMNL